MQKYNIDINQYIELFTGGIMEYNLIEILKALADPIRLSIVKKLFTREELCACDILDNYKITQPTLSFHMKKLTKCGLVSSRQDGTWVRYKVNSDLYSRLMNELNDMRNVDTEMCISEKCGPNK